MIISKFIEMRKIVLFLLITCITFTCNDREDFFANANINVSVDVESPLTTCTASYPGFIDLDYAFDIKLTPEYAKSDPLPLIAQYKCENSSDFQIFFGNKKYTPDDTLVFKSLNKKMRLNITKPGTYRFFISFFKENNKEKVLGKYEFTFWIGAPDLNIYVVRDGKRVTNLNESDNFLGFEGSFIVRVNSDKEDLNKGRLTLTTNITGSSVEIQNWRDKESKISQSDDLPKTIDFEVKYKNVQLGKTKFVFTAQSANSNTVLRDSMNIQESKPGTFALNTTYDSYKHFYSRPLLWVGQADSVEYLITPDPKAISSVYKLKFEMADPTKLWIFNTGNQKKQDATTMYEANKWYDFSGKLSGKLYYKFPSPQTYQDTIYISMQNGEYGSIQKYKLFVQCKQSSDFVFKATFKPTLVDGYDEIKFSELVNGITYPVVLSVQDENPYATFDYMFTKNNSNSLQDNIRQRYFTDPLYTAVDYQQYLGSRFGYLVNTKSFNVACNSTPSQSEAPGYSVNTFEWVYKVKRMSDSKEKLVTRKIRIINDLLKFQINLSSNNREYIYQNEPLNTYQLIYDLPSKIADEYTIQVTTTDANIADVYLLQKDMSYKKTEFGAVVTAPATHNTSGSIIGDATTGMIQVKGKKAGTAKISFLVKHVSTGSSQTVTKTIETRSDPVQYTISELQDYDYRENLQSGTTFSGNIHKYRKPRYKLRINKSSLYSGNVAENTIQATFANINTNTDYNLYIDGTVYSSTTNVNLAYDHDYIIEIRPKTNDERTWPYIGSTIGHNISLRKAYNLETPITTEVNNVKYNLKDYVPATLTFDESQKQITSAGTFSGWVVVKNAFTPFEQFTGSKVCYTGGTTKIMHQYLYEDTKTYAGWYFCYVKTATGSYSVQNCISVSSSNDAITMYYNGINGVYERKLINGTKTIPPYTIRGSSGPPATPPAGGIEITEYTYESLTPTITDNWGINYECPTFTYAFGCE